MCEFLRNKLSVLTKSALVILTCQTSWVLAEYCADYDFSCQPPQQCCGNTCCIPKNHEHLYRDYTIRWSVWNMWYFWFIVIFVLMSCFGGCGYYRRRQILLGQSGGSVISGGSLGGEGLFSRSATRFLPSLTIPVLANYDLSRSTQAAAQPAPQSNAQGGNAQGHFPAPPPYTEVISKPDTYPPYKELPPPYPGLDVMATTVPPARQTGVGAYNQGCDLGLADDPFMPNPGAAHSAAATYAFLTRQSANDRDTAPTFSAQEPAPPYSTLSRGAGREPEQGAPATATAAAGTATQGTIVQPRHDGTTI